MTEVVIHVCRTCTDTTTPGEAGKGGGVRLLAALNEATAGDPGITTRAVNCLMACTTGCNIAIAAQGKMQYVLGNWAADGNSVDGILGYVHLYRQTADGVVPYRQWPDAVKGRFIARVPPVDAGAF